MYLTQAEVCGFQHDGLHLQARSRKYGKLNRGQLLIVPPYLVKRQKQHFHHLEEFGIDLILGCNGFIWVGEHVEAKDDMVEDQGMIDLSLSMNLEMHDMLGSEFCVLVAEKEAERRSSSKRKR
ncbi:hypothetical protein JHK87_007376 [Glycine soja]|nr:hypothetical protein JHK87_007376 [Glycine soja]